MFKVGNIVGFKKHDKQWDSVFISDIKYEKYFKSRTGIIMSIEKGIIIVKVDMNHWWLTEDIIYTNGRTNKPTWF